MAGVTDPSALPAFPRPAGEDQGPAGDDPTGAGVDGEAVPGDAEEEGLAALAFAVLDDQGYQPVLDDDGDIGVRVQGQQMFVRCADSVPPLLRVFGQWLIGQDVPGDEFVWLRAANAVTATVNLVKATVHDDRLLVAVDLVYGSDVHLSSLLEATFEAVLGSVKSWHATVIELSC